ncbi:Calcium-dependent protein kinase 24 [Zea mays]|uniref:Calcium-dependent protein kinase 24 n=1 Tax=Zea mays TaxID=4577 RepID=A0A1D6I8I7_MAIZE|nr:Calcium-dependent protein kinase 24 [Zea mays]
MGGCHSAIAATKLKILRRGGRGAAAVLPVTNHDGPCCSSDHGSKEKKKKKKGARKGRKRASILGDAGTFDPDFSRRYRLGAELGRGEFGVTRRCEDAATGEALACKTIRRKRLLLRLAGPDATDVQREVEITRRMSEVSGGRVACLREACEDDDGVHLVMELCEGGELFDRIFERKHYSERAAAKLARTIVEVVQLCHENGVMHRDLKPENFLFVNKSEESPLKAIDFGLSVFFKPGTTATASPSQALFTLTYMASSVGAGDRFTEVVGSGCYMAPEVLKRSYGPEIDVVAMNLPMEEIGKFKEMFHTMDKNKDGSLSLEELKEGFRINDHPVPEEEIKMLLQAGDIHGTDTLDCEEFVTVLLHIKKMSNDEYLPKAFEFFDKDGNGFIEMSELMETLSDGELKPDEQLVNDIIQEVDKDKDGRISYPEFELMMKSGSDWRNASRRYSTENFSSLSQKLCKDTL